MTGVGAKKQRVSGQRHGPVPVQEHWRGLWPRAAPAEALPGWGKAAAAALVGGSTEARRTRPEEDSSGQQDDAQGARWEGLLEVRTFTPCTLPWVWQPSCCALCMSCRPWTPPVVYSSVCLPHSPDRCKGAIRHGGRNTGSAANRLGVNYPRSGCILPVWPWARRFISPSFGFLCCGTRKQYRLPHKISIMNYYGSKLVEQDLTHSKWGTNTSYLGEWCSKHSVVIAQLTSCGNPVILTIIIDTL